MPWVLEGEEVVTWVEKNEAGNFKKMMSEVGDWGHIGLAGYVTSLALTWSNVGNCRRVLRREVT